MPLSVSRSIRMNYLCYAVAFGCTYPFLAPYFKEVLHVSDAHLGLIMMIRPLMALVGQPFWSIIADGSGRRSHLAGVLLIIAALVFPLMMFVKSPGLSLALFAVWAFFNAPINTLSDSITLDYLKPQGRSRFASFRVFVSIGFLAAVTFIGVIYDKTSIVAQFGAYSFFAGLTLVFLWQIPSVPRTSLKRGRVALRRLLCKRNVLIFLLAIFLVETANGMALTFLSVYCKELGATNVQVGWVWGMGTLSEIVTMLLFSRIYTRLGVKKILLLGVTAVILKWFPFAHVGLWWQVLPLQLLHAFTLTFVYVGSVTFMDMESHNSIRVTAQAFYTMFILNMAHVVGGILAGQISQSFGMRAIYHASSAMACVALVILICFVRNPASRTD